jgi:hypothetical protein
VIKNKKSDGDFSNERDFCIKYFLIWKVIYMI